MMSGYDPATWRPTWRPAEQILSLRQWAQESGRNYWSVLGDMRAHRVPTGYSLVTYPPEHPRAGTEMVVYQQRSGKQIEVLGEFTGLNWPTKKEDAESQIENAKKILRAAGYTVLSPEDAAIRSIQRKRPHQEG